jgi:hypothetical protein
MMNGVGHRYRALGVSVNISDKLSDEQIQI